MIAPVIAGGSVGAWWGTRSAPVGRVEAAGGTLREQLAVVGHDRDFRFLLATFALQALATGSMLAGVDYVARNVLGSSTASMLLFVAFVGPALVVTPLWQRVGEAWGKKRGFVAASLLLGGGALMLVPAASLPAGAVYGAVAVVGVGYAGAQMFPLAMLPDVAARDAARSGSGRSGVYTGLWTAGETLGLALGPGLFGLVLALGGYRSSTGGAVAQPDSAVTAIVLGFSLLPAVLVAVSLVVLRGYRLDHDVRPLTGSGTAPEGTHAP